MRDWIVNLLSDWVNAVVVVMLVLFGGGVAAVAIQGELTFTVFTALVEVIAATFTIAAAWVAFVSLREWKRTNQKTNGRHSIEYVRALIPKLEQLNKSVYALGDYYIKLSQHESGTPPYDYLSSSMRHESQRLINEVGTAIGELLLVDPSAASLLGDRSALIEGAYKECIRDLDAWLESGGPDPETLGNYLKSSLMTLELEIGWTAEACSEYYLSTFR